MVYLSAKLVSLENNTDYFFKHNETNISKALEIIHSDIWGPTHTESN